MTGRVPALSRRDALARLGVMPGVFWLLRSELRAETRSGGPTRLVIGRIGPLDDDESAGMRLGLLEATRTASLLGVTLAVSDDMNRSSAPFGLVVGAGEPGGVALGATTRLVLVRPARRKPRPCEYWVAGADSDRRQALEQWSAKPGAPTGSLRLEEWHSTLRKFGALELNERYMHTIGRPMTSAAWRGWFAVKAFAEAYLRDPVNPDACAGFPSMTFDGHKGRPLAFDPATRGLRQPLYVVRRWNGADEVIAEVS